ncbi:MAG: LysM peptidoglycan-binding domain-containing M23 family metallopeptidase [Caulobacteraceae bacterium]|nr:LysM peptidoglycan-binding domain-containing M23 family metallopeptidase [Caulobacteraceae bacterium]
MASIFNRLTFAALTAALVAGGEAHGAGAQPSDTDAPVATGQPSSSQAAPATRPLDDDRYVPAPANPAPASPRPATVAPPVPAPAAQLPPVKAAPSAKASPVAPAQAKVSEPSNAPPAAAPASPTKTKSRRGRHADAAPAETVTPAEAPPEPKPEVRLSVQGKVEAAKDKTHSIKVGDGDTVNVISQRLQTPKDALIKANKLKKPYPLDLGQILKIPTPKAYVIQSGDTLYGVARRFNIPALALAEINDIDTTDRLHAGQQIALPIGVKDNGPIKTVIGPPAPTPPKRGRAPAEQTPSQAMAPISGETVAPPTPSETTVAPPTRPSRPAPPSRMSPPPPSSNGPPVVETAPPPSDSQIMGAGKGRFVWPVAGTVLQTFGTKAGGQRNDGLDIAAAMGAPVAAAAAGDVVYAGNQVPGFGNLVLIKHEDGWVTAYAHLSRTEVKIKDHVGQGDEIGQVGQTGGVEQPDLHFEIRYAPSPKDKARPIDPALVLPPAGK